MITVFLEHSVIVNNNQSCISYYLKDIAIHVGNLHVLPFLPVLFEALAVGVRRHRSTEAVGRWKAKSSKTKD